MYGPKWPFLLMYRSHNMRHGYSTGRVVNEIPRDRGVTYKGRGEHCHIAQLGALTLRGL